MLVHWTPFNEMARLEAEMNRLFDGNVASEKPRTGAPGRELARSAWYPAVDVSEDPDKIVLQADLPGVALKDLEVQIERDLLTLKGERRLAREEASQDHFRRYERVTGTFVRTFTLPPTVDAEKISASMKEGVLTLTLPKRPEAQPRQIKISVQ